MSSIQQTERPSTLPFPKDTEAGLPVAVSFPDIGKAESRLKPSYYAALDRMVHALWADRTGGISPVALWLAAIDWGLHLAISPGKQYELADRWAQSSYRFLTYALECTVKQEGKRCIEPAHSDRRFRDAKWQSWPFNVIHQAFLLQQQFLDEATLSVKGVSERHREMVNFCTRQALDMMSPSNFPLTNPAVIEETIREGGWNLVKGTFNFLDDVTRYYADKPPSGLEKFRPGETIAVTPGKVVYSNDLIELIQYEPTTPNVSPEPLLIVPAWIMKYYVLDLSPENSLVKYLVGEGFTVFMISWKNPDSSYRDYGLDHYRRLGIMASLNEIQRLTAASKVHMAGYCLGGTLLAIAASAMARDNDDRIKTLTFLAAQTDFTAPGELELFISESQLTFLEDMMSEFGVLSARHMAATFQFLRSNDLIWSRWLHAYLMGERREPFDLMAWNADATNMPARMHSEYLREIFFENRLAQGSYIVDGRPVALSDIRAPVFSVATERDHVAPWHSVYKFRIYADTALTFLLTNGGHNAGIISEPGHRNRAYRITTSAPDAPYVGPQSWFNQTPVHEGSWWPEWVRWLKERSGDPIPSKAPDKHLLDAPGSYIFG